MTKQHKKFRQPRNAYDDTNIPSKNWIKMQEFEGGKPRLETTVFDIPDDMWGLILRDFNTVELVNFMQTCRAFKEAAKQAPVYFLTARFFSETSKLKAEVMQAEWPAYRVATGCHADELNLSQIRQIEPYFNLIDKLRKLFELFQQCFGNICSDKPFMKAVSELNDYWEKHEYYWDLVTDGKKLDLYQSKDIKPSHIRGLKFDGLYHMEIYKHYRDIDGLIHFMVFVDFKVGYIEDLLRKEKAHKVSFFNRLRPHGMEELYQLMQLINNKTPFHYYSMGMNEVESPELKPRLKNHYNEPMVGGETEATSVKAPWYN